MNPNTLITIGGLLCGLIPVYAVAVYLRRPRKADGGQEIERQCYGRTTEDWLFAEQIEQGEKLQRAGVLMRYGDFASNHVDHVEFSQN